MKSGISGRRAYDMKMCCEVWPSCRQQFRFELNLKNDPPKLGGSFAACIGVLFLLQT
jgi:hypothetical protein